MADQMSSSRKQQEVEALFSQVGFRFTDFDVEAFERACERLSEEHAIEVHTQSEMNVARAKLTLPDGKNYQIAYDGTLQVS